MFGKELRAIINTQRGIWYKHAEKICVEIGENPEYTWTLHSYVS